MCKPLHSIEDCRRLVDICSGAMPTSVIVGERHIPVHRRKWIVGGVFTVVVIIVGFAAVATYRVKLILG